MFEELLTPPPRALPVACFRQLCQAFLPLAAIGTALLVAAMGTEVALYVQHREALRLAREGVSVEGTLVDKLAGRFTMRLTVAYRAQDRKLHTVRQWVRTSPANRWILQGDGVHVYYDPSEPDHATLEELGRPGGSLAGSLPVVLAVGLAVLVGLSLLAAVARFVTTARQSLTEGTLVPARVIRPPTWKNLWLAQIEFTQGEKLYRRRNFVPPGWRAAPMPGERSGERPAAVVAPAGHRSALLLIEPAPDEW